VNLKSAIRHVAAALVLCASAACAPPPVQAQAASASASAPESSAAVEAGRKAYTSYCTRCHGINLAVSGGAFYDLRTFPRDDKERFLTSVNKGKRAMPAWEGVVSAQDQEAIWVYIASVNGWGAK
jgi:mono/diheme cytochrome c family protein